MQKVFEYDTKDFLEKYIDLRSVLYINQENHLTPREKQYLIGCILMKARGKDLLSKEVKDYLEEELMFKNRGVDIYRGKLKKKGWIVQTTDGVILPPDLTFTKGIPKKWNFKFSLKRQD